MIVRDSPRFGPLLDKLLWSAPALSGRSPDAIVQPESASDVASVFRHAARTGQKVALRGSGHNYQGAALRSNGILVDLGKLDAVKLDIDQYRARVGAGVKGGHLIDLLKQHGLAFPVGHCADVALSGYLLSGGIGWNYGAWGPACASIEAVEIVTASGEIINASENAHPELFWAARGAGCTFFAAITTYFLKLHPLPSKCFTLEAAFPSSSAATVANWLNIKGAKADPTAELICLVGPEPDSGEPSITVRCVANGSSLAEARRKIEPLLELPAEGQMLRPLKCDETEFVQLPHLSTLPSGKRVAADQIWSDHPIGDLLLAVHHFAQGVEKSSSISLTALGGRATAPGLPEGVSGALSVGGKTSAGIYALWERPSDDDRHLSWVRAADDALGRFRTGRYIGEADVFSHPDRISQCFSPDALRRLKAGRAKYDPAGLIYSCL